MPVSSFPPISYPARLFRAVSAAAFTLAAASVLAQGVPHVTVTPRAYHTLVAPNQFITAAMCQSSDSYCLANAVGKPLFNYFSGDVTYATDAANNIYALDPVDAILLKVTPAGKITLMGGQYGNSASTPPLSAPATSIGFNFPNNLTGDDAGDLFFGTSSVIEKIDAEDVAHRITAPQNLATSKPVEGALANTQFVSPFSLASDSSGNLYISDSATCTIRLLSATNGTLDTIAGSLSKGCGDAFVVPGQKATSGSVAGAVAVGGDGTVYFLDGNLYSITTDGMVHLLAQQSVGGQTPGFPSYPVSGPAATTGRIGVSGGQPGGYSTLSVDQAGNLYFPVAGVETTHPFQDQIFGESTFLVEVTKGTAVLPSQVLTIASGPEPPFAYFSFISNPEGMPSDLVTVDQDNVAIDRLGRIITLTQPYYYASSPSVAVQSPFGLAYYDRNGSIVFNAETGQTTSSPQMITLINSGSAALKTVNLAPAGVPFYLQPTAGELADINVSGPPPFSFDKAGTCIQLYQKTGVLTLQPGESCTLGIDYTPNAAFPPAGSFTLYTNDPDGPLTVNLSASPINAVAIPEGLNTDTAPGTYYGLNISSTVLTASSNVSTNGTFTLAASVASSVDSSSSLLLEDVPVTPTGQIYAVISNNVTGALIATPTQSLDADGETTFHVSGLKPGSYSIEAFYKGDGKSAASFSTVQVVTVTAAS